MPENHRQEIIAAIGRGDIAAAETLTRRYLAEDRNGDGLFLLAVVYLAQGNRDLALTLFAGASAQFPQRADIAYNHGVALKDAGRLGEAAAEWRRAVGLDPAHRDAWANLALALDALGDVAGAANAYGGLLAHCPEDRDGLYNLANLCHRECHFEEATGVYTTLLQHHPRFTAGWINAGMALKACGQWAKAEECYRQALAFDPGSAVGHFNLAHLLLQQGRWDEGFAEYEWRLALPDAPPRPCRLPEWTGAEPPGTRVLLWNDQGIGDAIQFLRYAAHVAAKGHQVLAYVRDELVGLAASVPGIAAAIGMSAAPPPADAQCPLPSLPHRLGNAHPRTSWPGPYVTAPPAQILHAGGGRRIGLVWAGNPTHINDAFRSAHFSDFLPLLALPGLSWYSLQVGARADEIAASVGAGQIIDMAPHLRDFAATAAAIARLDLVIAVDTAVAHLAGAMGKPAWILLPAIGCDWRWQTEGETTAWYPSVHLFRQATPGDWAPVVAAMVDRLTAA